MAAPKPHHLTIVAAPEQVLSPAQRKFNQLLGQIEAARAELKLWELHTQRFEQEHAKRLQPLQKTLHGHQVQVARRLDELLLQKGWSKKQRGTMTEITCSLAAQLVDDAFSDEALAAEMKALHDRHAEVDFDTENRESMSEMKSMFEGFTGVDLGEDEFDSEEAMLHHAHQRLREAAEQAQAAKETRKPRRPTAAQRRQEQEQAEASQSVREVFRKLAAALHPDRADDEADRIRRTALMQRVNQAYGAQDLLALFALQLEIEQVDAEHLARATAQRAKHYNRVLEGQLAQLRTEVQACWMRLAMEYGLEPYPQPRPTRLGKMIDEEARDLRAALSDAEADLRELQQPAGIKRWLGRMARELERSEAMFLPQMLPPGFGAAFDMDFDPDGDDDKCPF